MGARRDESDRAGTRSPDAQRVFLFGNILGLKGHMRSVRKHLVQYCSSFFKFSAPALELPPHLFLEVGF